MKTSQLGVDLIKKHEGFVPYVYKDAVGYPTIGYGHLLKKGESFSNGISREEGEEILKKDLYFSEQSVLNLIKIPLKQHEFDALVSFVFNVGSGNLQASTLRRKLNKNDHEGAAKEFTRWIYARGVKLRGLIRRREEERDLFLGEILGYYTDNTQ